MVHDILSRRQLLYHHAAASRGNYLAGIQDDNGFAAKLRWWRAQRGLSQLDLALRAGISQRHLSFLELGRAKSSRDMVEQIATALDVPLRQHNALLVAAGYAPVWRETNLDAAELADINEALNHMMAQQEPYPPPSSIAAGICCAPTRVQFGWSNS